MTKRIQYFAFIFSILIMGMTPVVSEVVIIRELIGSFYGNELTIAIFLGTWLIVEACGTYISGKIFLRFRKSYLVYSYLLLFNALLFPVLIFTARIAKNIFNIPFSEPGNLFNIFISSFISLAPLAIIDGALFPIGSAMANLLTKPKSKVITVYYFEALGSVIAGVIVTFFLLSGFSSFKIASYVVILNLSGAILLQIGFSFNNLRNSIRVLFFSLSVSSLVLLSFFPFAIFKRLDSYSLEIRWEGFNVLSSENSIFGNITLAEHGEQRIIFKDGEPLLSLPDYDIKSIEELIHFALLSHPLPSKVFVIGQGVGGPAKEILKHPIERLEIFCEDRELLKIIKKQKVSPLPEEISDKRTIFLQEDIIKFLKSRKNYYDVIFLDMEPPSTFKANRHFNRDFFSLLSTTLKDDGLIALKVYGTSSYLDLPLKEMIKLVYYTLKKSFPHVKVIPGEQNIILAFKKKDEVPLQVYRENLIKRLIELKTHTEVISPNYIRYKLNERRMEQISEFLTHEKPYKLNSIEDPVFIQLSLAHHSSIHHPSWTPFLMALYKIDSYIIFMSLFFLLLIIFLLFRLKIVQSYSSISLSVAFTGLIGMTGTVLLSLFFQGIFGYLYIKLGFLFSSFMLGIFISALLSQVIIKKKNIGKNIFILFETVVFCLFIIILSFLYFAKFLRASNINLNFIEMFFYFLNIILGSIVGSEFSIAVKLLKDFKSSEIKAGRTLYVADLCGAFWGAFLICSFFLPSKGFILVVLLLLFMKAFNIFIIFLFLKNH